MDFVERHLLLILPALIAASAYAEKANAGWFTSDFPVAPDHQHLLITTDLSRECDKLFGTFGAFLNADGCYRVIRGECYKVVRSQPDNPQAQQAAIDHETLHCEKGDFHHGDGPVGQ